MKNFFEHLTSFLVKTLSLTLRTLFVFCSLLTFHDNLSSRSPAVEPIVDYKLEKTEALRPNSKLAWDFNQKETLWVRPQLHELQIKKESSSKQGTFSPLASIFLAFFLLLPLGLRALLFLAYKKQNGDRRQRENKNVLPLVERRKDGLLHEKSTQEQNETLEESDHKKAS